MRRVLACAVLSSALTMVGPVAAARPKLQVLAVMSEDAFENASALTVALKRAVDRSSRYSLGPGDYSMEVLTLSLGCADPPDAACEAKVGQKVGTDRYVWGSLRREGAEVVVRLRLWERDGPGRETTFRYSANLTDGSDDVLLRIATRAFAELSGGATAALTVTGPDGELLVDGEVAGKITRGRGELLVAVGKREVRLRRRGQPDLVGTVEVGDDGARLALGPTPAAGSGAEVAQEPPEDETRGPAFPRRAHLGWGALGLGGALAAGGLVAAFRLDAIDKDVDLVSYRRSLEKGKDVCEEAERGTRPPGSIAEPGEVADLCSEASTFTVLQYLFFGLGAVSVGAGVYLLLTPEEPAKSGLRFTPQWSPRRAGLDFTWRY